MSGPEAQLRDLARWIDPFDGGRTCAEAEAMLRSHDSWRTLVVRRGDGTIGAVSRVSFYSSLVGPLGYGWALNARRRLDRAVSLDDVLVADARETVASFGPRMLEDAVSAQAEELVVRDGQRVGLVATREVLAAIAERLHRHAAELDQLSRTDSLTGLLNRLGLRVAVADAIGHDAPAATAAILFADLDRFKVVNDAYGHTAGDSVLRQVGERMRVVLSGVLGNRYQLGRLAGDEFVAVCAGVADLEFVREIAWRIASVGDDPFDAGGHSVDLAVSVGGVLVARGGDVDDTIRSADLAMYEAKSGAGRVHVIRDGEPLSALTLAHLEAELPRALRDGSIAAHYQPVFRLADGVVTGFEALARWQLDGQPVSAVQLVGLAERTGLMPALTGHMLRRALTDLPRLRRATGADVSVAVNVSARYAAGVQFVDMVRAALDESGLDRGSLVVEITENVAFEQMDEIAKRIVELRSIGVDVVLDDLGAGYSSISQVVDLPLAGFKVDRSLVDRAHGSPRLQAVLRGAFRFACDHGLRAVAEGLEGERDVHLMMQLGCELGQGYVRARPMSLDAIEHASPARAALVR